MIPAAKLARLVDRYAALEAQLAAGASGAAYVKLSKEHAELAPVIEAVTAYQNAAKELDETDALIGDPKTDAEMRALAEDERVELKHRLTALEHDLQIQLLPRDAADSSSAMARISGSVFGSSASASASSSCCTTV